MDDSQAMDVDVAAVRALLAESAAAPLEKCGNQGREKQVDANNDGKAPRRQPKRRMFVARLASGRFKARAILCVSAILLLLLKPALLFGPVLLFAIVFSGALLITGPDVFWRRAIAIFRAYKRWFPGSARHMRVRGLQAVRRWHKLLSFFPATWSERLSLPNLRAIAKADQRHADVLEHRLSRLREENAI